MRMRTLACAALLAVLGGGPSLVARAADPERPPCCFTNPQYSGVCSVKPAKGETCASILAYLNEPNSQGKSYCGNTTIRGGWQQRTCATPAPTD